ncbi:hypothetical protein A2U01_0102765, partial [Trifolium medium]|nr:hypothetical protein [Trifolium medium]
MNNHIPVTGIKTGKNLNHPTLHLTDRKWDTFLGGIGNDGG